MLDQTKYQMVPLMIHTHDIPESLFPPNGEHSIGRNYQLTGQAGSLDRSRPRTVVRVA